MQQEQQQPQNLPDWQGHEFALSEKILQRRQQLREVGRSIELAYAYCLDNRARKTVIYSFSKQSMEHLQALAVLRQLEIRTQFFN